MPTITLGTHIISYRIEERPRRKYPAIQVDRQSLVTVLVPAGYPPGQIEPLVRQKAHWIVKHVMQQSDLLALSSPKKFVSGEEFFWHGDSLRLQISQAQRTTKADVWKAGDFLYVAVGLGRPASEIKSILVDWFINEAAGWLPGRVAHYSEVIGVRAQRLKIREYTSRWGFCREDGLIALNWRIIQAPLSVIDYVVVHELIHRRHPHHRPVFWHAVGEVLPDYRHHKEWLRKSGAQLQW